MLFLLLQGTPITVCLLYLVVLIFSATVHEISHAYVAYKLGDPTAKLMGRMTLNPRVHLTRAGTFAMLLLPIGWANPVIINPRNFKHPSRDTVIVSLAGPISNLLMAFIGAFILVLFYRFPISNGALGNAVDEICIIFTQLNILLFIFNLLPIPPLDGSKIITSWLPYRAREWLWRVEQYGIIILFLVIYLLSPVINWLENLILNGIVDIWAHLFL